MTTSDREEPPGVNRDWSGQVAIPVVIAVITSWISILTKFQPLAVVAATAGVALVAFVKLRWQMFEARQGGVQAATVALIVAYCSIWLAAYLLVGSL